LLRFSLRTFLYARPRARRQIRSPFWHHRMWIIDFATRFKLKVLIIENVKGFLLWMGPDRHSDENLAKRLQRAGYITFSGSASLAVQVSAFFTAVFVHAGHSSRRLRRAGRDRCRSPRRLDIKRHCHAVLPPVYMWNTHPSPISSTRTTTSTTKSPLVPSSSSSSTLLIIALTCHTGPVIS
jgi:hypothetical protein